MWLGMLLSSMAMGDPVPAKGPSLTMDGVTHPVAHAELSLRVETETYDGAAQDWIYGRNPSLVLALEVRVDDGSGGGGGALAPDLYFHLPSNAPALLKGFTFQEGEHTAEAWIGNDAPALQDNRLELLSELKSGPVGVRWTGTTERGAKLVFEGEAEFMGLSLKVKRVTDVDGFMSRVWPALEAGRLELAGESEVDFGDDFEDEERQHWMELHYDLS